MATPKIAPVRHEETVALDLKRPIAVLDLETTGTFTDIDRIIEIGILKITPNGVRTRFRKLINPGIRIPLDSSMVHGIKDTDVAHKPKFKVLAKGILKIIAGCDLVGYNISHFDLPMLCAEFERAGVEFSPDHIHVIDVKDIYHHHEQRRLCDAVKFYCDFTHDDGAHSAIADARATWQVLQAQINRHGLPRSVPKLADWLEENARGRANRYADSGRWFIDRGKQFFVKGKYTGLSVSRVAKDDPSYLDWILGLNDVPEDTRAIIQKSLQRTR